MSDEVDAVVIGAGVVGLACARELARSGREVLVLERHTRAGSETSSRNSGVIHAGLYYAPGTIKAATCIRGRQLLYEYCASRGIPHQQTGKLVVATDDAQREPLLDLARTAEHNGVPFSLRDACWLKRYEPSLRGVLALDVPVSGVVDPHALMNALRADAADAGALFVFRTEVEGIEREGKSWAVVTAGGTARGRLVVNAAGLQADRVAHAAGCDVDTLGWRVHPWKGCWFQLQPRAPRPRRALVYPIPVVGGLGIHLTRGLDGQILAGPDSAPSHLGDYRVREELAGAFAESVAQYLPGIEPEHLRPAYAGLRPKLRADGGFADFVVEERPQRLIQLVGIESPGLTAALAIAERVAALASRHD